jgi:dihydrofolate reductase
MLNFLKKIFQKRKTQIKMIVAIDLDNGIGKNNDLLFSIKKDMQHFTEKTLGNTVIMGSNTYESIPKKFRPLKDRQNIILHRNKNPYPDENVLVAHSIDEAISLADKNKEIWVIGGASIYKQMIPLAKELEITQIFARKDADTFFPEFKNNFKLVKKSKKIFDEKENLEFQFQTWVRR